MTGPTCRRGRSSPGYIFFTATGQEFDPAETNSETGFVGRTASHDVFLFYEPDVDRLKNLALSLPMARALPAGSRRKLVFAPTKYLDREFLHKFPGSTSSSFPSRSTKRSRGWSNDPEGIPEADAVYCPQLPRTARGVARKRTGQPEARTPNGGSIGYSERGARPWPGARTTHAAMGSASIFPPSASRSRPAAGRRCSRRG